MHQSMGVHARAFFVAMCVELGLYAAYLLWSLHLGRDPVSLVLRIALIFIGIRAVLVGGNFVQTWLARAPSAPQHRLNLLTALRLFLNELYAAMRTYPFYFALEPWLVPSAPRPGLPHRGPPIVLIPGFLCNRGYFGRFRRYLRAHGYGNVWAVTLESTMKNTLTWLATAAAIAGTPLGVLAATPEADVGGNMGYYRFEQEDFPGSSDEFEDDRGS